ncbi:MAG: hypothetical protein JXA35_06265 [Deltaproteobacteria bacterium]|nr:hypothetical protein [Deltaproteobacteria bacterium]
MRFNIDRKKRHLILAGAVLIFIGVIYRLLPLLQSIQSEDSELILKERQLEKYRQTVQQGSEFEERLVYLKRILKSGESGLLSGETPSLAAVDIQNILTEIVGTSEVEIKTVRVLNPEDLDKVYYKSIPVEFSIISNIRQLKDVLYKLDSSPKYLTVKKIMINVGSRGGSDRFQSNITVAGYMKRV